MSELVEIAAAGSWRERRVSREQAEELAAELRARIAGEVRFDAGSRALYATDGSNYRQVPIGVVVPRSLEDVMETVAACRRHGAPVLSRGGGTSLAGQCCNVAVVMDFSKYLHRVLEIDAGRRVARVQPGTVLDRLRSDAERHQLTFGPDPATHDRCTLGGMIGNNSCGVHSIMAGKTVDNVEELDVLLYDGTRLRVGATSEAELESKIRQGGREGQIYGGLKSLRDRYAQLIRQRYPDIPRRVSGYNLDALLPEQGFHVAKALVGTEGTCVTVLEAKLRLVPSPQHRVLAVLGYPDVYVAADHIPEVMGFGPIGLEGVDEVLVSQMKKTGLNKANIELLPEGRGWLLVEFGADSEGDAKGAAQKLVEAAGRVGAVSSRLFVEKREQKRVWEIRESALGATAVVPGEPHNWEGWEDSAVRPGKLGGYLRELTALMQKYGYKGSLYGHFGHACVHTRNNFDLTSAEGIRKYRSYVEEAADLVVRYGGSLSGEHGDGQSRAELLPKMFGPELVEAFREFKAIWDPEWKMNPGKVVEPYRLDENLRLGAGYDPPRLKTHFHYPEEHDGFAGAALRCVGVGKCRRDGGGTMCPSYMVTREERHSTRGRGHLLFEMLQGDPLTGGWKSEAVKEALDLCLSCKGCKEECPVHVDMATYKAEFLAHYYEGRVRPPAAYAMGLIHWWARAASVAPGLANLLSSTPGLSGMMKRAAGIAPQRSIPQFAPQTFKQWFRRREPRNLGAERVILWPDTFNNHFHPESAAAATEVLEALGYQVTVPRQALCCGRPLYDFGMLATARRMLEEILEALKDDILAGTPVVGLEPSCVAVFRDEMPRLMPENDLARRLAAQTFLFSEFLEKRAVKVPQLRRKAVVHGHCHHKAVIGFGDEEKLLKRIGLEHEILDSGCCGMAGGFGFERGHYEVSVACGERVLLPAVRGADPDTIVIADGFSCRQQIEDLTGRRAVHLAEVMRMAMTGEEVRPERPARVSPVVVGLGIAAVAGLAWWLRR